MAPRVLLAVALVALAGCGPNKFNHDVRGFTQESTAPAGQAILRSIATYRMTTDASRACALVTAHFLKARYGGKLDNCRQVIREASRHLPDSARVQSEAGGTARVFIAEPTATRSIYLMRLEAGVWKIDDITEAR